MQIVNLFVWVFSLKIMQFVESTLQNLLKNGKDNLDMWEDPKYQPSLYIGSYDFAYFT